MKGVIVKENGGLRGSRPGSVASPANADRTQHLPPYPYPETKNSSTEPVPPMQFLMLLRQHFPQFSQQARGKFMQQDAEEFMGALFGSLAQVGAGRLRWVCVVSLAVVGIARVWFGLSWPGFPSQHQPTQYNNRR